MVQCSGLLLEAHFASTPGVGGSNPPLSAATRWRERERERGVEDMKLKFDEVLYDLEQERLRVDEDRR